MVQQTKFEGKQMYNIKTRRSTLLWMWLACMLAVISGIGAQDIEFNLNSIPIEKNLKGWNGSVSLVPNFEDTDDDQVLLGIHGRNIPSQQHRHLAGAVATQSVVSGIGTNITVGDTVTVMVQAKDYSGNDITSAGDGWILEVTNECTYTSATVCTAVVGADVTLSSPYSATMTYASNGQSTHDYTFDGSANGKVTFAVYSTVGAFTGRYYSGQTFSGTYVDKTYTHGYLYVSDTGDLDGWSASTDFSVKYSVILVPASSGTINWGFYQFANISSVHYVDGTQVLSAASGTCPYSSA
jgi:hypothetical protein